VDRETVRERIEREYQQRGDTMGWRLLYSPWRTVENASVAFIGLNPGTSRNDAEHSVLSCEDGSAYEIECWRGHPPGQAPLQLQVQEVFRRLGVKGEDVLAGNLIPIRSPNGGALADRRGALSFGKALWRDIFACSRVERIVAMGRDAQEALVALYQLTGKIESRPAGWGNVHVSVARNSEIEVIGVPHLSRFLIMDRPRSQAALDWAFG